MLWPFNHFLKPRTPSRGTIETIYGMIVAQAREPLFYRDLGVPDTVNGRFDMVVLHMWLVLRRMKQQGDAAGLAQPLFDRFCSDMDHNLREMGVGDLAVPRRMRQFGEAFYGRQAAYGAALDAADLQELEKALARNILGEVAGGEKALARYVRAAAAQLATQPEDALIAGRVVFPSPESFVHA